MTEKKKRLPPGPRKKHGGYAYLSKGTLPENRRYIERHLSAIREGLIRDLGPLEENLTTAQAILIDRVVTKLGIVRCIEEYIKDNTVFVGKVHIPMNLATDSGVNSPLIGAKRRWDFIIPPCGYDESSLILVFS